MDRIYLLDAKFYIEVLDIFSKDYEIGYHKKIVKDVSSIERIAPLFANSYDLFNAINLPVALKIKNGKEYLLLSRYWVLKYLINKMLKEYKEGNKNPVHQFPAIVFEDSKLEASILVFDKLERDYFERKKAVPWSKVKDQAKLSNKSKPSKQQPASGSKATNDRHDAHNSGRTCPFCPGPIVQATGKYVSQQTNLLLDDGPFKVKCGYHKNKYKCGFVATFTETEKQRFRNKKHRYFLSDYLVKVPDEKCPDCGDDVYKRRVHQDDGSIKIYKRCRQMFLMNGTCSWSVAIK